MQVNRINSANNNSNITASAAIVGGAAGGLAGWHSKPFLKKGELSDTFVNSIYDGLNSKLIEQVPDETKAILKKTFDIEKRLDEMKSISDIKSLLLNPLKELTDAIKEEDFPYFKASILNGSNDFIEVFNIKLSDRMLANITEAEDKKELFNAFSMALDEEYAGKSLDEIKNAAKGEFANLKKSMAKGIFEICWDGDKKKFVHNDDNFILPMVKKAARSIKAKYAAIYGVIGAAVLGLGTHLVVNNNKKVE